MVDVGELSTAHSTREVVCKVDAQVRLEDARMGDARMGDVRMEVG